ncbi:MAG: MFS transporter [Chloroflexota bacterium]
MTHQTHSRKYPQQFWLMFAGLIFSTTGTTMIWPFLMIFVSERLGLPFTAVTSLMTIKAIVGLAASLLAGSAVDRFGRKWVMVLGLIGNGLVYFLMSGAQSYLHFALLMALGGIFSPIYRVGTDAMLADMFEPEKRVDAYALLRMGRNIGVALGPAIGGFMLSISYTIGLYAAAAGLGTYGLCVLFFVRETLHQTIEKRSSSLREQFAGYIDAFKDGIFMRLVGAFTLVQICATLVWVLLSVYLKQNFGIPEEVYGWIPTTNALMIILFQVLITRWTKKFKATAVMMVGSIFYALSMLIISLSSDLSGFWLAMVVMTIGELILMPTVSAFVANLAPADKRGRYMSIYGLTWNVATGTGPLAAGILSDQFGLRAPWIAGIGVGLTSFIAFLRLGRREARSGFDPQDGS